MIVIDKLCYRSRLRYVNASEKFLYTVVTLVICVAGRSPAAAAAAFAANGILTVRKGGIPLSRYIRLLMVPLAFLILGSAAVIVNVSEAPLDAFAFPVGDWYITGSRDSVRDGALLWAVALSAVSCLYFLSLNTTMTDILEVLRKLHVPALLIELMLLIYRFIFVLLETASAITTAQKSRLETGITGQRCGPSAVWAAPFLSRLSEERTPCMTQWSPGAMTELSGCFQRSSR